jgi:hypothetical protein
MSLNMLCLLVLSGLTVRACGTGLLRGAVASEAGGTTSATADSFIADAEAFSTTTTAEGATAASPAKGKFPASWGEPPRIQTMDLRPLAGGYGYGSSTLSGWISKHIQADRAKGTVQFPPAFGSPPPKQKRDRVTWPFGYGQGSSTIAEWLTARAMEVYGVSVEEAGGTTTMTADSSFADAEAGGTTTTTADSFFADAEAFGTTTTAEAGGVNVSDTTTTEPLSSDTETDVNISATSSAKDHLRTKSTANEGCDTSSWDIHFNSSTKACAVQSGARQPVAGQCATSAFQTSTTCGNCIGDYISCSWQQCSVECCDGSCIDSDNCRACGSDHCVANLRDCTGGYDPTTMRAR